MHYLVWLNLVTRLAGIVAQENGAAPRELAYLNVLTNAANIVVMTDEDLTALKTKYEEEVANDTPTTASELSALADRIAARSAGIQAT